MYVLHISGRSAIAVTAVTVALLMAAGAYLVRPGADVKLPSFDETRAGYDRSDARLYDRHGTLIHELRVDFSGRKTGWTRLPDISPALVRAVIASEDRRFYTHKGVDWYALAASAWGNATSKRQRGASTVTMQLAARVLPGAGVAMGRRGVRQKLAQVRAARVLDTAWTKDEILEAYLNLVTYRGELAGISAASRGMFDKEPEGLDVPESLVLASLIRAPNADAKIVGKRALALARALGERVGEADIGRAVAGITAVYRIRPAAALAPHVARMLLTKDNREVVTTLDGGLQRYASELVGHYMGAIKNKNAGDCALLVVDNRTGGVLAYAGNSGDGATARYVDGVQARRQAGSTLKPFLYGLAFERRILTPASLLEDSPLDVPTAMGTYSPGNYDNSYRGVVSARTALASSLNIPAVRTLALMGEETFKKRLDALGVTGLREGDYYGLSLALGTAEVSLWELVNAYRTLANGGVWGKLSLAPGVKRARKRVYPAEAAFLVSDILSDREARSTTFGLENPLSTRFWSAVKTGTSKDMRDNWCVGYSSRYTVGVWVGNFSGEPMWNVTGITGAAPIWYEMMDYLHQSDSSIPPKPPAGVTRVEVEFPDTGGARQEWFVRGTEPVSVSLARAGQARKILYPPEGTVIALDPDIPAGRQRVFFESTRGLGDASWYVDGEYAGGEGTGSWAPARGRHVLVMSDAEGYAVDEVRFSVR